MENKDKFELNDNTLEAVAGGVSDTVDLAEERMPLGWYVTCVRCTMGFQVSLKECPCCGGTEVWHGTDKAIHIYDPRKA